MYIETQEDGYKCNNFLFIRQRLGLVLNTITPPVATSMRQDSGASIYNCNDNDELKYKSQMVKKRQSN